MSPHDTVLFIRRSSAGITLILLYVDDMIITGDDSASIRSLQHFLSQHFEMKDLDTLSYFLGFKVTSFSDGYYLSQAKYVFDLLSKAGITDNKTVSTLLEYNAKLTPLDGEPISDATHYRQLVGSLIYFMLLVRIFHMLWVWLVSSWMHLVLSTMLLFFEFSDMSKAHFIMVCITPLDLLSSFMLIQMLTRQVIRLIDALSQVSVSC